MIDFLKNMPVWQTMLIFWIENCLIVVGVIQLGNLLRKFYAHRNLDELLNNATPKEWMFVLASVTVNTGVTFGGYWLWKNGFIKFDESLSWRIIADFILMILIMDLLMFVLHLFVHRTFFYKITHYFHHQFTQPEPIDLFILDPLETIAFGGLWLIVLMIMPFNLIAVIVYLTANVTFGMLGHIAVEPFPAFWVKHPVLRFITTSTFHYQHHNNKDFNYGFYTTIWDELFQTLDPEYASRFEKAVSGKGQIKSDATA
jgi:sterol desaturase/sphingolipid hydroxylase (fatty acid hydroxylase superfamily)